MKAQLMILGLEGHSLEVQTRGLLQGAVITVDALAAPKGKAPNEFILTTNDGRSLTLRLKRSLVCDFPALEVDGVKLHFVPPLKWYEYVLSFLVVLLISSQFSSLQILIPLTLVTFLVNVRVLRLSESLAARYLLVIALSLALPLLFFMAEIAIGLLIGLLLAATT